MNLNRENRIEILHKLLDSICPPDSKKKVLEIGPEEGILLNHVPPSCEKYAVDIVERKLPGVTFKLADMNSDPIPFPDGFFDVIICSEVLEHLNNPDNVFLQINKKLKMGGVLVFSTPNLTSLASRLKVLFGKYPGNQGQNISLAEWPGGHIRCYNPDAMKFLFSLYGFKIDKFLGATSGFMLRELLEWYPHFPRILSS